MKTRSAGVPRRLKWQRPALPPVKGGGILRACHGARAAARDATASAGAGRRRSGELFGAIVILGLLAACGERDRTSENAPREPSNHIRDVNVASAGTSLADGRSEHTLRVEFTLPPAFRVSNSKGITMTDTAGRTWRMRDAWMQENDERQRISVTFEVAEDSRFGVVHIGDLDVDVTSGVVTRRATSGNPRSP